MANALPSSTIYFQFPWHQTGLLPADWTVVLFKNGVEQMHSIEISECNTSYNYALAFAVDATENARWKVIVKKTGELFAAAAEEWFVQSAAPSLAEIVQGIWRGIISAHSAVTGSAAHYLNEIRKKAANNLERLEGDVFSCKEDDGETEFCQMRINEDERTTL